MHRTQAENNESNLFTDGPPGTRLGAAWFNSVQEEICYAIEQAGITVQTAATDTKQQLKSAIETLGAAAAGIASGNKAWFYQDAAPVGWTLDATPSDALLAVKGGATYTTGGAQAGTWTQLNHTHGIGSLTTPNHTHTDNFTTPAHTHTNDFTVDTHSHTLTTATFDDHTHTDDFAVDAHQHDLSGGAATAALSDHAHGLASGTFANHSHHMASGPTIGANIAHYITNAGGYLRSIDTAGGTSYSRTYDHTSSDGSGSLSGNTDIDGGGVGKVTGATDNTTPGLSGGVISSGSGGLGGNTDDTVATLSGGITSSGNGVAISGGVTSSGNASVGGTLDNGAPANTWRPLAQVGIICTKD